MKLNGLDKLYNFIFLFFGAGVIVVFLVRLRTSVLEGICFITMKNQEVHCIVVGVVPVIAVHSDFYRLIDRYGAVFRIIIFLIRV